MMAISRVTALLAATLAACGGPALRPGAPEAEVRQALGRPAVELPTPEGGRQLAYPSGPFGLQTYMAHLGRDGRLERLEQVLDDSRFHAITPGMTSEELLRHIGPPYRRMRFDNLGQTAWDYKFRDTWGYLAMLSVMVDDRGLVVSRITQRFDPPDRQR